MILNQRKAALLLLPVTLLTWQVLKSEEASIGGQGAAGAVLVGFPIGPQQSHPAGFAILVWVGGLCLGASFLFHPLDFVWQP